MNAAQTRYTYADYAKTPEDERYELLNGELVKAPAGACPADSPPDNCDSDYGAHRPKSSVSHSDINLILSKRDAINTFNVSVSI